MKSKRRWLWLQLHCTPRACRFIPFPVIIKPNLTVLFLPALRHPINFAGTGRYPCSDLLVTWTVQEVSRESNGNLDPTIRLRHFSSTTLGRTLPSACPEVGWDRNYSVQFSVSSHFFTVLQNGDDRLGTRNNQRWEEREKQTVLSARRWRERRPTTYAFDWSRFYTTHVLGSGCRMRGLHMAGAQIVHAII